MEQIKATVDSGGLISCQIPIDVQEWEAILSNPEITYTGYKTAIMAFYNAQGQRITGTGTVDSLATLTQRSRSRNQCPSIM